MDIIISRRLRELRQKKGNTQEELGNFLTVSTAAVSKWERGETYPDLTLVPKIAAYYSVTVDYLLGVDELRKNERIQQYEAESKRLYNVGKIPEAVSLWREALKEFPNDLKVISNLANAVLYQNPMTDDHFKETIELSKRILEESTDQELRESAILSICLSYSLLNDFENAKKYALMGGDLYCSKQALLSRCLTGNELIMHNKQLICNYVDEIGFLIDYSDSKNRIKSGEFYLKLLNLVFDDGFMGFYSCRAADAHFQCALGYAEQDDWEKTRYHLEQMAKRAKEFDGLKEAFTYHGTIIDDLTSDPKSYTINTEKTNSEVKKELIAGDKRFDKYREKVWFTRVMNALS